MSEHRSGHHSPSSGYLTVGSFLKRNDRLSGPGVEVFRYDGTAPALPRDSVKIHEGIREVEQRLQFDAAVLKNFISLIG